MRRAALTFGVFSARRARCLLAAGEVRPILTSRHLAPRAGRPATETGSQLREQAFVERVPLPGLRRTRVRGDAPDARELGGELRFSGRDVALHVAEHAAELGSELGRGRGG